MLLLAMFKRALRPDYAPQNPRGGRAYPPNLLAGFRWTRSAGNAIVDFPGRIGALSTESLEIMR